jgi:hypothetical protein
MYVCIVGLAPWRSRFLLLAPGWYVELINTLAHTGVDVMITIFGDFRQFSAKKMSFFKKQRYDQILEKIAAGSLSNNANIFVIFCENIFKILA